MTIKAGRVSGRTPTGFHSRIQNGLCSLWQMQTVSSMQCRQVPAGRCLLQQDGPQTLQASGNLSWPLMQGGAVHQEGGTAEWLHPAGLPVSRHRWLVMQAAACPWSPRDSSAESTLSGTKVVAKHTLVPIAPHLQPHNPARQG